MIKRKFTSKEEVLLLVLALLLIAFVYLYMVQMPVESSSQAATARIEAAQAKYDSERIRAERKAMMEGKLESIKGSSGAPVLADYDNIDILTAYLNQMMAYASTYNMSFYPAQIVGNIATRRVDLSFHCEGYTLAESLIRQLEECPYYCQITGLTMAADNEGGGLSSGMIQVRVGLTFYEFVSEPVQEK